VIPIVVYGETLVRVGAADGAPGAVNVVKAAETDTEAEPAGELPLNEALPAMGPAVPLVLWLTTKVPDSERGKYGLPITPLPKS
jgi:hypothetical protein